jgi:hyperosmotically inducible protein
MSRYRSLYIARLAMAFALLAVVAGCQDPAAQESPADAAVSARVRSALAAINVGRDYSSPMQVETTDGVVELRGFVSNHEQIYSAGVVAARVKGVSRVENHLRRMPPQGPNPYQEEH